MTHLKNLTPSKWQQLVYFTFNGQKPLLVPFLEQGAKIQGEVAQPVAQWAGLRQTPNTACLGLCSVHYALVTSPGKRIV